MQPEKLSLLKYPTNLDMPTFLNLIKPNAHSFFFIITYFVTDDFSLYRCMYEHISFNDMVEFINSPRTTRTPYTLVDNTDKELLLILSLFNIKLTHLYSDPNDNNDTSLNTFMIQLTKTKYGTIKEFPHGSISKSV